MKIALGCDHGGYAMKEDIKKQLEGLGHEVKDCGTYSTESCDYPIFGEAQLCRQHNNANMMAIGAGFTGPKLAAAMVETFLSTAFEGGRHARRVALMDAIEG